MTTYRPFSADGHTVRWSTWDGEHEEALTLTWENEGWTASGLVGAHQIQYVLRLSATWQLRQFLLFRDLDDPDLWLGCDGHGKWGEVNGAHRQEFDGAADLHLPCTPFTHALPILRLPLLVGDGTELPVVVVDVETLDVQRATHRYERLDTHRWRFDDGESVELEVDEHGLPLTVEGRFRRV
jgi:hypothetical protein